MTFLSSRVTAFHARNSSGRTGSESGAESRQPSLDPTWTVIDALARTMLSRDPATAAHGRRVQGYAVALATVVCKGDDQVIQAVEAAALLHDIGKLGIPDRVLLKPGPLSRDEYEQVKLHTVMGAEILDAVDFGGPLALIVRHHHENWDGSGYPDGLRGDAIPIGARVLSIADCYDALTSDRPYRCELPHDRALAMIGDRRGTMYDPEVAGAFVQMMQRLGAGKTPARADGVPVHAFRLRSSRLR